jgi:phosphatidylethanolamine-binding protein (PEBP) family uncharacterized protein
MKLCSWFVMGVMLLTGSCAAMELKSPAFQNNQQIPDKCAYQRENLSPPLLWTDIPLDVKSFALVCDDPDAPGGDWVIGFIQYPSSITSLEEGYLKKRCCPKVFVRG